MDFLDSLLDKIPIIRDMDKKKRMLAVGFIVFAVISILGILIDAIASAGGVVALIAVAVGFLFMAAIIIADFLLSKSGNKNQPPQDEQYNFFEDSPDDYSYQNDTYGYDTTSAPSDYNNGGYDNYNGEPVGQDVGYDNGFNNGYDGGYEGYPAGGYPDDEPQSDISYGQPEQNIEYTVNSEPVSEPPAPKLFGGLFRRGQQKNSAAVPDEMVENESMTFENDTPEYDEYGNEYNVEYTDYGEQPEQPERSSFEFTLDGNSPTEENSPRASEPQPSIYDGQVFAEEPVQTNYSQSQGFQNDFVGEPVMNFPTSSNTLKEEVVDTANFVAPNIVTPPPVPDVVGAPVMSIPFRGDNRTVTENSASQQPAQPVSPLQQQAAPQQTAQSRYVPTAAVYAQPVQTAPTEAYASNSTAGERVPAYQQGTRGQEIETFFDNMDEDELLYSDCVEVWASDAKPSAIKLLKQIESLSDKKMADALGREAEYMNAMLDRIYYFTMLDSIQDNLELKKYNFSVMVKECLRRFSPFFMEKRIGLLWKGLDIDIVTDKRWLIFALTQVIFNAVEFTGLGGKIAISAKKEGSLIHLMVDDDGCGISENDLPRIFMAGFMGDNVPNESGRRTGMGLFITRSVIEKLGGTVTADSAPEKGTRITIILPENP